MYIYITEKSKIKKKNAEKLIFDISLKGNVSHINCFVLSHAFTQLLFLLHC